MQIASGWWLWPPHQLNTCRGDGRWQWHQTPWHIVPDQHARSRRWQCQYWTLSLAKAQAWTPQQRHRRGVPRQVAEWESDNSNNNRMNHWLSLMLHMGIMSSFQKWFEIFWNFNVGIVQINGSLVSLCYALHWSNGQMRQPSSCDVGTPEGDQPEGSCGLSVLVQAPGFSIRGEQFLPPNFCLTLQM